MLKHYKICERIDVNCLLAAGLKASSRNQGQPLEHYKKGAFSKHLEKICFKIVHFHQKGHLSKFGRAASGDRV